MSEQKNFNRDTKGDDYKSYQKDSNIGREVDELIKSKATDTQAWQKLRSKYGNNPELMEKILEAYKEKLQRLYKKAKKFKQVLYDRYSGLNLPYGEMLKKAKKYQRKYKFTDDEFDMFVVLSMTDKTMKYDSQVPTTKMAKTLGYDSYLSASSKLNVKADEQGIVEEINNKYGETKPLHAQVLLQSLTYQDCAPEALSGTFDERRHNPYAYVHPVVAALFIPRIKVLDEQMLIANIGYIVNRKAHEQPVMTLPDHKLYWDMITDPNDVACTLNNAVVDLKNRFILQTQLWDAVINLRQGKYYYGEGTGLVRFMQALENCRNVIHDAPDLTYVKDEGTILRRLLSTFSLYPTYVSINRLWGLLVGNQYGYPSSPLDAAGFTNITRVPMITLRLPLNVTGNAKPVLLEDALTQPQWFVENKVIVPKSLQIIHSNEVLFFYVGRRYQTINVSRMAAPYNFTQLPMTVTGYEALNPHPVTAPKSLNIMNDTYLLRSVVLVEKTTLQNGRDMIVGSSALIVKPINPTAGVFDETCILYDPQSASQVQDGTIARNKPVRVVPSQLPFNATSGIESFEERTSTRGTIFMYQKVTDNQNPLFMN
jgi:hypothetical protein